MRKTSIAALVALALVTGIAAVALAQTSGGDTTPIASPTSTATAAPSGVEDISGPCDEPEHAADPGCQPGTTITPGSPTASVDDDDDAFDDDAFDHDAFDDDSSGPGSDHDDDADDVDDSSGPGHDGDDDRDDDGDDDRDDRDDDDGDDDGDDDSGHDDRDDDSGDDD
jgi:hypothetical protein